MAVKNQYPFSLRFIFCLSLLNLSQIAITRAFVIPNSFPDPTTTSCTGTSSTKSPKLPKCAVPRICGSRLLLANNSKDDLSGEKTISATTIAAAASPSSKQFVNQVTIQFNNKLNKMARNFDKHSAPQVEELLRQTVEDIDRGLELEIQPNVVTFTAVINAWARSTQKYIAAQRAEAILNWMIELAQDDDNLYLDLKPNCIAYNAAITAWIRSPNKESHNQAERIMNQLWDAYSASDQQDPELKPTARTFNLVINAIARSREPKCADRAAALLVRMEDLYLAGDEEMEPNAQTFGAIINAYANSDDPNSSDKAAQILQQMESLYQLGYKGVKPNTFVYNACLNAFAKSSQEGGSAEQASQLLELMEQQYSKGDASVKPDVITYSTCINAYANSKTLDAGTKADAVLRRMTQLYLEGDKPVKPNSITYSAAIKAWMASAAAAESKDTSMRVQAANRAEEILQLMSLQFLAGDGDQRPTKGTFDLVRESMSDVQDNDGAKRVERVRKRILDTKLPRRETV
jgi:hypothetical protein